MIYPLPMAVNAVMIVQTHLALIEKYSGLLYHTFRLFSFQISIYSDSDKLAQTTIKNGHSPKNRVAKRNLASPLASLWTYSIYMCLLAFGLLKARKDEYF